MKTVQEIRIEKLKKLRDQFRFQSELAALIGKHPSHLHQWMIGKKSIGHRSARDIERALGKPTGWLDNDHSTPHQPIPPAPPAPTGTPTLSPDEAELLAHYRQSHPVVRSSVKAALRDAALDSAAQLAPTRKRA